MTRGSEGLVQVSSLPGPSRLTGQQFCLLCLFPPLPPCLCVTARVSRLVAYLSMSPLCVCLPASRFLSITYSLSGLCNSFHAARSADPQGLDPVPQPLLFCSPCAPTKFQAVQCIEALIMQNIFKGKIRRPKLSPRNKLHI